MYNLKKLIIDRDIKKVAISRFLRTIPLDTKVTKNAGPFDSTYIKKYIKSLDVECDVILQNKKSGIQTENIKYFRDVNNLNEYDLLIFQSYTFNLYTGIWEQDTVDYIDRVFNEYNGHIAVIYNDPNIQWNNPYPMMISRPFVGRNIHDKLNAKEFKKTQKDVDAFKNKEIIALFNGSDWETYWEKSIKTKDSIEPKTIIKIDLSEYIFHSRSLESNKLFENPPKKLTSRKYDICYFGSDRKGSRKIILDTLFKDKLTDSVKKQWIGYNPKFKNCKVYSKKMEHQKLADHLENSIMSLVIGDEAHNDNIKTFRFFENNEMNVLSLIHISYDTKMELIKNPVLREYCYFEKAEDINKILDLIKSNKIKYYDLLEMQNKEIERLFKVLIKR